MLIIKWLIVGTRRATSLQFFRRPQANGAFALPAHENEVLFSKKNRANGATVVAVVVGPAHAVRVEVHVPRAVRVAHVEPTRPIVAVFARSREEDGVAVGAFHFVAVNAVSDCPLPCAVFTQLRPFGIGWHTPFATPVYSGSIVFKFKHGFVIYSAIIAICAVLCKSFITSVAPLVSTPIVSRIWFGFTPSVVTAVLLGFSGTNVAGCPFQTARQAEVNPLVAIGSAGSAITWFVFLTRSVITWFVFLTRSKYCSHAAHGCQKF